MHPTINWTAPLSALFLALSLTSQVGLADPLHKFGDDGAWCHVDSGWMFPKDVGGLARAGQPYSIDGNNDAGAEYGQPSGVQAVVEIYAADSAAGNATLEGAKADAGGKVGERSHLQSEQPFEIDAAKGIGAVKVTYAPEGKSAGTQANLYFIATDRWRVKVLASTQDRGKRGGELLDAFVKALPWNTLGTDPGIH